MASNKIKLEINIVNLDEAIEKANQLKATLEECGQLINSLNQDKPVEVNLTLDGKSIAKKAILSR